MPEGQTCVLPAAEFDRLIDALRAGGWQPLGPRVRDGAIVYDELGSAADLPRGMGDEQEPGRYRLVPRGDETLFDFAVGPHAWKRYVHPPLVTLWRARRGEAGFELEPAPASEPRRAFIGVRACELQALARLDRVLLGGPYADEGYKQRREAVFVVAVNCAAPAGTCFCASMHTGPRVTGGFDLLLTELPEGEHRFVLEAGSERGRALQAGLGARAAEDADRRAAEARLAAAEQRVGRSLETAGLAEALQSQAEGAHWDELGRRCLACANCTLVCPTCFCVAVTDHAELGGAQAERRRRWDSCFTLGFSYIHGGSVRTSVGARYRQWITHKLGTWQAQFGESGCVGCGRCLSWCPAGIDITAEAAALRRRAAGGS